MSSCHQPLIPPRSPQDCAANESDSDKSKQPGTFSRHTSFRSRPGSLRRYDDMSDVCSVLLLLQFPNRWITASCRIAFRGISGTRRCSFSSRSRKTDGDALSHPEWIRRSINTTKGGCGCFCLVLFCFALTLKSVCQM